MNSPKHDMRQMTTLGRNIENNSFNIIDKEAGNHGFPKKEWQIVRRVIHSTADFEFINLMKIHSEAITKGIQALKQGCPIIVDVKMIVAGLNMKRLESYNCKVYSYISDKDVIQTAKELNSTRAIQSIQKAYKLNQLNNSIIAIGNAPTALLEMSRLIREGNVKPALIIGVPVGFVSAAKSKQEVLKLKDTPYIVAEGRKGGSAIAVSIIHALLYLSIEE